MEAKKQIGIKYATTSTSSCTFAKGAEAERIKENLRLFILNLNQHTEATLYLSSQFQN